MYRDNVNEKHNCNLCKCSTCKNTVCKRIQCECCELCESCIQECEYYEGEEEDERV